jgi:hypothetical protein
MRELRQFRGQKRYLKAFRTFKDWHRCCACRHSLRHAQQRTDAQAGAHRPSLRQGLCALQHAPERPVQLAELEEVPDILAELASVQMHAIQTSGNCIRNTTTDQFAGVARTRSSIRALVRIDPPVVDLSSGVRLPAAQVQDRGAVRSDDRAAIQVHDIGLQALRGRGNWVSACSWAAVSAARRSSAA